VFKRLRGSRICKISEEVHEEYLDLKWRKCGERERRKFYTEEFYYFFCTTYIIKLIKLKTIR
jgi:hypothetical protein